MGRHILEGWSYRAFWTVWCLYFYWMLEDRCLPYRTKCNFSTTVWDFYTHISWFIWERSCYNSEIKKIYFSFLQSYSCINILCHIFNPARNNQQQLVITARRVCIARTMPWQDVCPSHAGIVCKRLHICSKFFLLSGSHTIVVFPHQTGWQYSDGDPPNGGVECKRGIKIRRFSTNIGLYLGTDAR